MSRPGSGGVRERFGGRYPIRKQAYPNLDDDGFFCLSGKIAVGFGMRFVFTHSHAFPMGAVIVERNDVESEGDGEVDFADGVSLIAEWWRDGADIILDIPSYRTAKGTTVKPHRWRLTRKPDGTWRSDRDA